MVRSFVSLFSFDSYVDGAFRSNSHYTFSLVTTCLLVPSSVTFYSTQPDHMLCHAFLPIPTLVSLTPLDRHTRTRNVYSMRRYYATQFLYSTYSSLLSFVKESHHYIPYDDLRHNCFSNFVPSLKL